MVQRNSNKPNPKPFRRMSEPEQSKQRSYFASLFQLTDTVDDQIERNRHFGYIPYMSYGSYMAAINASLSANNKKGCRIVCAPVQNEHIEHENLCIFSSHMTVKTPTL